MNTSNNDTDTNKMTTNTSAQQLDRDDMITALIAYDMDLIESEGGYHVTLGILRYGFKGYEAYTDAELFHAYLEAKLPLIGNTITIDIGPK